MKLKHLQLAAAVAAALTLGGPALAQTHAHEEGTPAKLSLHNGQKWTTDAPLRTGMSRIRALVEPHAAQTGKLTAVQYGELALKVEVEVGSIVANCKLEPKADAMLHLVIADLGTGVDVMAGKNAKRRPAEGVHVVAAALNQYGRYFDDPGFKPVKAVH